MEKFYYILIIITLIIIIIGIIKKYNLSRFYQNFIITKNIHLTEGDIKDKTIFKTMYRAALLLIIQRLFILTNKWTKQVFDRFLNFNSLLIHNIIVICLTLFLFYLLYRLIKSFTIEHQRIIENIKKQNSKKLNQELRKQFHDFRNHLGTLNMMLKMDKLEKASKYIEGMIGELKTVHQTIQTGNDTFNALLYTKIINARKQNINLKIEVLENLSDLNINDWDLNRIMGNLIDNSMEALQKIKGKKNIEVLIKDNKNNYIFEVKTIGIIIPQNVEENIFKENYTSKDEPGHGMGLNICQELVNNYKGKIYISKDIQKPSTSFIVEIPE